MLYTSHHSEIHPFIHPIHLQHHGATSVFDVLLSTETDIACRFYPIPTNEQQILCNQINWWLRRVKQIISTVVTIIYFDFENCQWLERLQFVFVSVFRLFSDSGKVIIWSFDCVKSVTNQSNVMCNAQSSPKLLLIISPITICDDHCDYQLFDLAIVSRMSQGNPLIAPPSQLLFVHNIIAKLLRWKILQRSWHYFWLYTFYFFPAR